MTKREKTQRSFASIILGAFFRHFLRGRRAEAADRNASRRLIFARIVATSCLLSFGFFSLCGDALHLLVPHESSESAAIVYSSASADAPILIGDSHNHDDDCPICLFLSLCRTITPPILCVLALFVLERRFASTFTPIVVSKRLPTTRGRAPPQFA